MSTARNPKRIQKSLPAQKALPDQKPSNQKTADNHPKNPKSTRAARKSHNLRPLRLGTHSKNSLLTSKTLVNLGANTEVNLEQLKRALKSSHKLGNENRSPMEANLSAKVKCDLKEFIKNKLEKVNFRRDMMSQHKMLSYEQMHAEEPVKVADFKDIFDHRQQEKMGEIKCELSMREKLMMTSQQNWAIRGSFPEKQPMALFVKELDRQKRRKMMKKFRQVFCKNLVKTEATRGPDSDRKAGLQRVKTPRVLKRVPKTKSARPQIKATEAAKKHSLLAQMKQFRRRPEDVEEKHQAEKNDIKKMFWASPSLLRFLEENEAIRRLFEKPETKAILRQFPIGANGQQKVLNRSELANLAWKMEHFFKCEQQIFRRMHLGFVLGVDLAFKLKSVYKELGGLITRIFAQLAKDFTGFKKMVGKLTYQTVRQHQDEILKMRRKQEKESEICEKRIQILRAAQDKKDEHNRMKDNERDLMKKLIFELQTKSEKQLRTIQSLENRLKCRPDSAEKGRIQDKFRSIVNRLMPKNPKSRRMSFAAVSSRIIQLNRRGDPQQKSTSVVDPRDAHQDSPLVFKRVSTFKQLEGGSSIRRESNKNKFQLKRLSKKLFSESSIKDNNEQSKLLIPNSRTRLSFKEVQRRSFTNQHSIRSSIWHMDTRNSERKRYLKENTRRLRSSRNQGECDSGSNRSRSSKNAKALKIGPYLVDDLEQVSKFYLVPDGEMKHRAVQTVTPAHDKQVQTDLSLARPMFNRVFEDPKRLVNFVREFHFRRNIGHSVVLKRLLDMKEIRSEDEDEEDSESDETRSMRISIKRQNTKMRTLGLFTKIMRKNPTPSQHVNKRLSIMLSPGELPRNLDILENTVHSNRSNFGYLSSSQIRRATPSTNFLANNYSPKNEPVYPRKREDSLRRSTILQEYSNKSITLVSSKSNHLQSLSSSDLNEDAEAQKTKKLCRKVFSDFLKEEIFRYKRDRKDYRGMLILVLKFLMCEEMKSEKLAKKNRQCKAILSLLKTISAPSSHFGKLQRSKSLGCVRAGAGPKEVGRRGSSKIENNFCIEINKKPLNLGSMVKSSQSCPSLLVPVQLDPSIFKNRASTQIFFKDKFKNIWNVLKVHVEKNYKNFMNLYTSQGTRGAWESEWRGGRGEQKGCESNGRIAVEAVRTVARPQVQPANQLLPGQENQDPQQHQAAQKRDPHAQNGQEFLDVGGVGVQNDQHPLQRVPQNLHQAIQG